MPPGVQTGLRDERVNEPTAMPLDEYIAETMALLTEEPEATEIVVDATKPLRFAERDGVYEQLLHRLQHLTLALTGGGCAPNTTSTPRYSHDAAPAPACARLPPISVSAGSQRPNPKPRNHAHS